MKAQLAFWMLAAIDGHAKNFSIHILPRGRFHLTPLYDVISAWPVARTKPDQLHEKRLELAMALRGKNRHYRVNEINREHFNTTARHCGLGADMNELIDAMTKSTSRAIEDVESELPEGFPEPLFQTITDGLRKSSGRLQSSRRY